VLDGRGFRAGQQQMAPDRAGIPVVLLSAAHEARATAAELDASAMLANPSNWTILLWPWLARSTAPHRTPPVWV
jgi:hypothetical protein